MEQTDFEELKVRDLIINFLFAGSDIVGVMMSWTLALLAKHPEIQEKLVNEIRAACPNKDYVLDTETSKVPLLLACVKEALRMFPPVPMISRRCEKAFTVHIQDEKEKEEKELHMEVGAEVFLNFWFAQKTKWDRSKEFDPTRFLLSGTSDSITKLANDSEKNDEKERSDKPFSPFSVGRRNCLGQTFALTQGNIVLARILLRYKISLVDPTIDFDKIGLIFTSALQPVDPLWFILETRN
jgi:cytochrome P450 family 4 subfamily B polypeptide 1/leukotriene-B4 20-monooxygenase/phylloquinone omega-hydroxylase